VFYLNNDGVLGRYKILVGEAVSTGSLEAEADEADQAAGMDALPSQCAPVMAQAVPFFGSPAPGLSGGPLPVFMAQPTGQFFTVFPPPEVFGEAVGEQLPTGPAEQRNSRTKKRQRDNLRSGAHPA
jgi:hypothetical protein